MVITDALNLVRFCCLIWYKCCLLYGGLPCIEKWGRLYHIWIFFPTPEFWIGGSRSPRACGSFVGPLPPPPWPSSRRILPPPPWPCRPRSKPGLTALLHRPAGGANAASSLHCVRQLRRTILPPRSSSKVSY